MNGMLMPYNPLHIARLFETQAAPVDGWDLRVTFAPDAQDPTGMSGINKHVAKLLELGRNKFNGVKLGALPVVNVRVLDGPYNSRRGEPTYRFEADLNLNYYIAAINGDHEYYGEPLEGRAKIVTALMRDRRFMAFCTVLGIDKAADAAGNVCDFTQAEVPYQPAAVAPAAMPGRSSGPA